jgi:hypothetical protein
VLTALPDELGERAGNALIEIWVIFQEADVCRQEIDGREVPMKIATRIALLQWQANPADPVNLWRLMIAWITPGMREPREGKSGEQAPVNPDMPLEPTGRNYRAGSVDAPGRRTRFGRYIALAALLVFGVGLASSFRYEPMPQTDDIWERLWDRWRGQVCLTPRPEITDVHGIACSESEVEALKGRIRAEIDAREELKRPAREAAEREMAKLKTEQDRELEREKKARVAAQEKWEELRKAIDTYVHNPPYFAGAPDKWQINKLRSDGHSEEFIAKTVMPWREKLLTAGAPKEIADEYFGGDPYLSVGAKP